MIIFIIHQRWIIYAVVAYIIYIIHLYDTGKLGGTGNRAPRTRSSVADKVGSFNNNKIATYPPWLWLDCAAIWGLLLFFSWHGKSSLLLTLKSILGNTQITFYQQIKLAQKKWEKNYMKEDWRMDRSDHISGCMLNDSKRTDREWFEYHARSPNWSIAKANCPD